MDDVNEMTSPAEAGKKKLTEAAGQVKERLNESVRGDEPTDHSEGGIARAIEYQTARIPSDAFLWSALGMLGVSALFQMRGRQSASVFAGTLAPMFLMLGVYNKLVKVAGSDRLDPARQVLH